MSRERAVWSLLLGDQGTAGARLSCRVRYQIQLSTWLRFDFREQADPCLKSNVARLWSPGHSNLNDVSVTTSHGNWHMNK